MSIIRFLSIHPCFFLIPGGLSMQIRTRMIILILGALLALNLQAWAQKPPTGAAPGTPGQKTQGPPGVAGGQQGRGGGQGRFGGPGQGPGQGQGRGGQGRRGAMLAMMPVSMLEMLTSLKPDQKTK